MKKWLIVWSGIIDMSTIFLKSSLKVSSLIFELSLMKEYTLKHTQSKIVLGFNLEILTSLLSGETNKKGKRKGGF